MRQSRGGRPWHKTVVFKKTIWGRNSKRHVDVDFSAPLTGSIFKSDAAVIRYVKDATSHRTYGTLREHFETITTLTYQYDSRLVCETLLRRLSDDGKYWRHIYKALLLIDCILKNGSTEAVAFFKQHVVEIKTLQGFQKRKESTGQDVGVNIRERSKHVVALLTDDDELERVREHQAQLKDKFELPEYSGDAKTATTEKHKSRVAVEMPSLVITQTASESISEQSSEVNTPRTETSQPNPTTIIFPPPPSRTPSTPRRRVSPALEATTPRSAHPTSETPTHVPTPQQPALFDKFEFHDTGAPLEFSPSSRTTPQQPAFFSPRPIEPVAPAPTPANPTHGGFEYGKPLDKSDWRSGVDVSGLTLDALQTKPRAASQRQTPRRLGELN